MVIVVKSPHMTSQPSPPSAHKPLADRFGRQISYLRLSVTDRCDFRCTYCMAENMVFLPKPEVLTLEELLAVSDAFIARGVRRIRLTGGEPLVRKGIDWLIGALGSRVKAGALDELTLTTNGSQLTRYADCLARAGVRRVNVSLDTLDPDSFRTLTRRGDLVQVIDGIDAAKAAGLDVKINAVAVKGVNDDEFGDLIDWCLSRDLDLTLIETMPMGTDIEAREDTYVPLMPLLPELEARFNLKRSTHRTGGPARYWRIGTSGRKLGLITPLSGNFCDGCNRVRVTCTGRIYMCLGQDDHIDLRAALRDTASDGLDTDALNTLLDKALYLKPKGHDFSLQNNEMTGTVSRHMSQTGG